MKAILSERNIVVLLFIMVLVTFSLAQEDSKKKLTNIYAESSLDEAPRFPGVAAFNLTGKLKDISTPGQ